MIKFTKDEMNEVFEFVKEYVDFLDENEYVKITLENITNDGEVIELLKKLVDYQIKIKIEGDHRNDWQIVDYVFYFKNPIGNVTKICTEMCLAVGWNHHKNEEIE